MLIAPLPPFILLVVCCVGPYGESPTPPKLFIVLLDKFLNGSLGDNALKPLLTYPYGFDPTGAILSIPYPNSSPVCGATNGAGLSKSNIGDGV